MALVASLFVARRVVRPLETLRHGVERLAAGDLNSRLELKTGDEIEVLAEEFNKMTQNLQQAHAGLEHKVAARTQELAVANERLKELGSLEIRLCLQRLSRTEDAAHGNQRRRGSCAARGGGTTHREANIIISPACRSNTQHLAGLINDLLDLSKIESGKIEIKSSRVSLGGLVHEVVESLRPIAAEKSLPLKRPSVNRPFWSGRIGTRSIKS